MGEGGAWEREKRIQNERGDRGQGAREGETERRTEGMKDRYHSRGPATKVF